MQMFDKAESEYRELSEKKRIVENDKEKIKKVHRPIVSTCLLQTPHPKGTFPGRLRRKEGPKPAVYFLVCLWRLTHPECHDALKV